MINMCPNISSVPVPKECGSSRPKSPFKTFTDGVNVIVKNLKGEDVTEYFNARIEHGIVSVDFKKAPSFEEWRKIAGK
jgi:hypothetical protein